ncbi:MAG TPA: hemerythrin domain-containing protein [Candidatus Binataceae bacterium]|nr:hemerythrin domain-containing protein [Candidatus Binataceae bacterium]
MQAVDITDISPCGRPLPDLEVPMINTMVTCLGSEHRKFNYLTIQLALAASRLSSDPDDANARQRALELWDEIRRDLWPHLQIEDELVFSWGEARDAIPHALLDILKKEHQEMHKLVTSLPASPEADSPPLTLEDGKNFGRTLLVLAQTLDSHVERYDGEVLPSIIRALFRK